MSYSNHTTNYNLPLYVGTDKPTYLGDFNTAMSAIDSQMKANADSASGADTKANSAISAVGTLANLTTTAKTDLVSAVNEVNTTAGTAQSTANNASTSAGNALEQSQQTALELASLENKFNLTATSLSVSCPQLTPNPAGTFITCAKNSDGSMAKIYGRIRFSSSYNGDCVCTISDTGLRPTEAITFQGCAFRFANYPDGNQVCYMLDYTLNTNGTITVRVTNSTAFAGVDAVLMANLLFIKDFGDQPE